MTFVSDGRYPGPDWSKLLKLIGAHVSTQGGVENAPLNASAIGANAFALFTANQRRWQVRPITEESARAFKDNCGLHGFGPNQILPHDSYLINLGATDEEILVKSRGAFLQEMKRCEALGLGMINFHPGAHKGRASDEQCLEQIAAEVDRAHDQSEGVTAVVEITAGQGSNVGYTMEHLAYLLEHVADSERIGACLDTCHLFAGGYDITSRERYEEMMESFERIVGIQYLRGMHLNDSQHPLGSRKDRHARLGEGEIGWEPFEWIIRDPRTDDIPLILETPDENRWNEEISALRGLIGPQER